MRSKVIKVNVDLKISSCRATTALLTQQKKHLLAEGARKQGSIRSCYRFFHGGGIASRHQESRTMLLIPVTGLKEESVPTT